MRSKWDEDGGRAGHLPLQLDVATGVLLALARSQADTQNNHFPLSLTIPHQSVRIGVVHGQQVVPVGNREMLAALARQMDVDVLISGGTHR